MLLCMPQNVPECASEHLKSMPPDPPRVKDCRADMFSISANDIAPQIEEVMYGPDVHALLCVVY